MLQDASAVFERGHIYAVMGESGAGKSTIFNLLLKLWHTSQGEILIDDLSIDDWNTDTLRKSICCVAQEDFILNMSIRDNIVLDDASISDEEVNQAAQLACMQDFAIDEQINNTIGESGCTISGGQRQRIALARMFLSKASVILMDEPTAALDRKKTLCIMENIRKECSDKLVIIISHSDDVASYCDETYFLKHGKLQKSEKE
ncbi:MAG: ATP-binding cassette domain-containing protein [Oscillospiraceae bacterium]|nr:ATP-binding cassette domain-containing protein [Oscillospiraceae bacterium]